MTTKNEIIEWLATSNTVERIFAKHIMNGCTISDNDRKDFQQEIYMVLLEMPEERIITLFDKGQLVYYILSIIRRQLYTKKSKINTKLGRNMIDKFIEFDSDIDGSEEEDFLYMDPIKIKYNRKSDGSMFDEFE